VNELFDTIPETVQTTVEVHGGRHFYIVSEYVFSK
jgi:ribosomal protein S19